MSCVRPGVRSRSTRAPRVTSFEGPDARTIRTVAEHGGDGGGELDERLSLVQLSSSLPLSLSETSVPSERPVATPTSCVATTRSPTENDKRPAREGVRLVGAASSRSGSARVRLDVRQGAPQRRCCSQGRASHTSEPRKTPSTPASARRHGCGSPIPQGPSLVARKRGGGVLYIFDEVANGTPAPKTAEARCPPF